MITVSFKAFFISQFKFLLYFFVTYIIDIKLSKGSSLSVKHIWFDYHKICAKGKTSNIGQLISILEPSLAER